MIVVFVWLTSLGLITSSSVHAAANSRIYSFLWLIFYHTVYMYVVRIPHLLHPLIYWWRLGCFHILAIVNSTAVNFGMHVSFQIRVFIFFPGNYPEVGLLEHMVALSLVFLRTLHTVLHSGWTNLHSHQQYRSRAPLLTTVLPKEGSELGNCLPMVTPLTHTHAVVMLATVLQRGCHMPFYVDNTKRSTGLAQKTPVELKLNCGNEFCLTVAALFSTYRGTRKKFQEGGRWNKPSWWS